MNKYIVTYLGMSLIILIISTMCTKNTNACSTIKLQHGKQLIYGHNLNQGDIGVPGLIFINKRGIIKKGRTWGELASKNQTDPSSLFWISRYGSVSFNCFGKDFPDGGMNEAGLYIWEMSEDADYPKNEKLPKLNQMNWMQYILDNCASLEEAIQCASSIEIEGWGWHYFVGDVHGNTAAIAFIDDKVVVHKGEEMPVPGLFNSPYEREMELLKYYKGFGGHYVPDLNDPEVPRFVKTAVMLRDYNPSIEVVDYGFMMLNTLRVNDDPEWSVIFDVGQQYVYFKTRQNPEIKSFSMNEIDFSNSSPTLILNMDIKNGGDVIEQLHPYTNEEMSLFTKTYVVPILPEEFLTSGGITLDEYIDRFSSHADIAQHPDNHYFKGNWSNDEEQITLSIEINADAVFGHVTSSEGKFKIEHLGLVDRKMIFTYRKPDNTFIEVKAEIDGNHMEIDVFGIEDYYGHYTLVSTEH